MHYLYPGETKLLFTTLSITQMLLDDASNDSPEDVDKYAVTWIQAALLFATVWGVGGVLDLNSRKIFDYFVKSVRSLYKKFINKTNKVKICYSCGKMSCLNIHSLKSLEKLK